MKEVVLFSESVELGGGRFSGWGISLSSSASVGRLTCATVKVMMKTIHCFFFWMRVARLRERTSFRILSLFEALSVLGGES